MSKPIKLTEKLKNQAVKEFETALSKMKLSDGKVNYTKGFVYKEKEHAKVLFTPMAYAKMVSVLMAFDSEVAWHGVGCRIDKKTFLISDILVYPQTVTGTTVEMDVEKYSDWLMNNDDDERFDNIVMQGHSHVKMSTSPSATDCKHQEDILSQLKDDMFYIFMIWNKRLEHTTKIFDLENNIMYEDDEIDYGFSGEDCDIDEFVDEAKEIVVERKYEPVKGSYAQTSAKNFGSYSRGGFYGYGGYPSDRDDDFYSSYGDYYNK